MNAGRHPPVPWQVLWLFFVWMALPGLARAGSSCPPGLKLYGNSTVGQFCCEGSVNEAAQTCSGAICALDPAKAQGNPLCPAPDACAGKGTLYGLGVGGFCCDGTVSNGNCSNPESICALDPTRRQGSPMCCAPGLHNYGASSGGFCCQGNVNWASQSCSGTICALDAAKAQGNPLCPVASGCAGHGQMYGISVGGFCCDGRVSANGGNCYNPPSACAVDPDRSQGFPLCSTGCPANADRESDGLCHQGCKSGFTKTAACTCQKGALYTDCGAYDKNMGPPSSTCPSGTDDWGGICYSPQCPSGYTRTTNCTCAKGWDVKWSACAAENTRERISSCPSGSSYFLGLCYQNVCPSGTHRTAACTCQSDESLEINTDCFQFPVVETRAKCTVSLGLPTNAPLDDTFYVTTDLHFGATAFTIQTHQQHASAINLLQYQTWPQDAISPNAPIGPPLGLVATGDSIHYGHPHELEMFRMFYEPGMRFSDISPLWAGRSDVLETKSAVPVRFQVWPGYGNHDIMADDAVQALPAIAMNLDYIGKRINQPGCGDKANFDALTANYSWNWGRLHLVQLNVAGLGLTGVVQQDQAAFNGVMAWLESDLKQNAANGADRPVVIFMHYGPHGVENLKNFPAVYSTPYMALLDKYRVVAVFSGHNHEPETFKSASGIHYFTGTTGGQYNYKTPSGIHAVRVTDSYLDVGFYEWCSADEKPVACTKGASCAVERCSSTDGRSTATRLPTLNPAYSVHVPLRPTP